jgi:two-component system LytT family response regulator
MTPQTRLRAFLVDDEELALRRLSRMLEETGRVEIAGTSMDPIDALSFLSSHEIDVLFLDIQMPGMNGFEMLTFLETQPLVVFTTAFDQYALKAFEVNSVDYLLKPIEHQQLERALNKLDRIRGGAEQPQQLNELVRKLAGVLGGQYPARIASRVGERMQIVELSKVSHFFAEDKLTYAAAGAKNFTVDHTISELEQKLDPRQFYRIHRAFLVHLPWVREMDSRMGGPVLVRLKDEKGTELPVARDRVRGLRDLLSL